MKVLFDQNVPANLVAYLPSHEVKTAAEMVGIG
jgi:predicted nuclease of predicted toxin-antitoxin system